MRRFTISAMLALATLFGVTLSVVNAADVSGTVKKVDASANTVVVTVDGKDKTFKVTKDTSFTSVTSTKSKKGKVMEKVESFDSLTGVKVGAKVTLLTDTVDEKEIVKSIKVEGGETTGKAKDKTKKKKADK